MLVNEITDLIWEHNFDLVDNQIEFEGGPEPLNWLNIIFKFCSHNWDQFEGRPERPAAEASHDLPPLLPSLFPQTVGLNFLQSKTFNKSESFY